MTHLDDDAVFEEEEEDLFTLFIFFFPEKEEDNKGEEDARKRWCAVEDAVMMFLSLNFAVYTRAYIIATRFMKILREFYLSCFSLF